MTECVMKRAALTNNLAVSGQARVGGELKKRGWGYMALGEGSRRGGFDTGTLGVSSKVGLL